MDTRSLLLTTALHHRISEPTLEAGFERVRALTALPVDYASFCDTISALVSEGLVHEPVRLPDGALQCHWQLELTASGVAAARSCRRASRDA